MTVKKREDTLSLNRKYRKPLCREFALENSMDLSQDRQTDVVTDGARLSGQLKDSVTCSDSACVYISTEQQGSS